MGNSEKSKLLFTQLVVMFHTAAMQQMGKIKNPVTEKIERDLTQAQFSIDMLDMIKEKMHGNLSPDEERLIQSLLQELKLNYVDEVKKDEETPSEEESRAKEDQ